MVGDDFYLSLYVLTVYPCKRIDELHKPDGICAVCMHVFEQHPVSYSQLHLSHTAPDSAPHGLTANSTSPTTVALSWQAPHMDEQNGRLLSYTLEYSISGFPGTAQEINVPVDSSEGGIQQSAVEGLQPYTTYQFRVRAVNEVGAGPFSNPVVIITLEDGKWNMSGYI